MDMATVLDISPKAISLNGTLGLAFGARGTRFAAHYEPSKMVINISKLNGPGALAHEWGHALDHYLTFGADPAETVALAERNAALRPNAEALTKLAAALRQAGRFDEAEAALRRAAETGAVSADHTEEAALLAEARRTAG